MKMLKFSLVVLLTLSNLFLPSQSVLSVPISQTKIPDEYAPRLQLFEEFVKGQMAKDKIPGLTIGFTKDKYTWVKGFGYADLENKVPASAGSAYRLASVTKTFTGTAIVQLVERGKIKLDEEIQTYVPYYPKQQWPVTIRQLLVHLGGDAAIEWLKIATEMYPKEAALYGTLGDFHLKQNRREEAINAYKKALDVDPNFEHAKEMLKKLIE